MANVTSYDVGAPRRDGDGWLAQVRKAYADFQAYRRTVEELSALTDRELSDLGLSRFAIRDVAYDSVYGG